MASSPDGDARFRWQALFQHAAEPLFVLNRQRRILFVNRAWEALTGLTLAEVKGQACRRRPRGILTDKTEILLSTLAPPVDVVVQGQPGQTRRLLTSGRAPAYWQIAFFPLAGAEGPAGFLGKISVLERPEVAAGQPLSEKMLALRLSHARHFHLEEMIGAGPLMGRLREQIRLAGQTRLPVLLVGPPGSGKEWVARAIHHLGPDREKVCVCLDCACLPPRTLDDLLLGEHRAVPSATIYLKNVAALPLEIQERLLQSLDTEGESPHRLIAGLEEAPQELVQSGKLLHALYCRLSPLVFQLPVLTESMDDFAALVEIFLRRANQATERALAGLTPEAIEVLRAHSWPRNLRELYEILVGACLRAKGESIDVSDLPFHLRQGPMPVQKPLSLDAVLEQVERRLIVNALRQAKNNKSRAAELLTIWRARLLRRMENLGIKDPE